MTLRLLHKAGANPQLGKVDSACVSNPGYVVDERAQRHPWYACSKFDVAFRPGNFLQSAIPHRVWKLASVLFAQRIPKNICVQMEVGGAKALGSAGG